MGDWNTLHAFNDKAFDENTLKVFSREEVMNEYYSQYLKHCLNGQCSLPVSELKEYFFYYQHSIKKLFEIGVTESTRISLHSACKGEYHFRRFLTFILFRTCSDFYPYFKLGYRAFSQSITFRRRNTISEEIINAILYSYNEFNWDSYGIRKGLSFSDVRLLEMDLENIEPEKKEFSPYVFEFKSFIHNLSKSRLGLISGQNLSATLVKNEVIQFEIWKESNLNNLVFKE